MKTTLLIVSTAILMVACKKEDAPEPAPINYINHITFNGTEIQISNEDTARYWPAQNITYLIADNSNVSVGLSFNGNSTGDYQIEGNSQNVINSIWVNGVGYSNPSIMIRITRYDAVGGRIQGTFDGTFKQNTDTAVVVQACGAFDLYRGQDI